LPYLAYALAAGFGESINVRFPGAPLRELRSMAKEDGATKELKSKVSEFNASLKEAEAIENFEVRKARIELETKKAKRFLDAERVRRKRLEPKRSLKSIEGVEEGFRSQKEIFQGIVDEALRLYEEQKK
jgi:hypothetical protein